VPLLIAINYTFRLAHIKLLLTPEPSTVLNNAQLDLSPND